MPKVSTQDGESHEGTYLETVEKASWNWFYTKYTWTYFKLLQAKPKQHGADNAVEHKSKMAKRPSDRAIFVWYSKRSQDTAKLKSWVLLPGPRQTILSRYLCTQTQRQRYRANGRIHVFTELPFCCPADIKVVLHPNHTKALHVQAGQ